MLRRPRGLAALRLAALGELVADKLPSMPSRLMPPGLLARACLGALGGGALARIEGSSEGAGAVMGALAALAAAAVGFSVRRYASRATRTPDVPWALVEDGACLLVGAVATR